MQDSKQGQDVHLSSILKRKKMFLLVIDKIATRNAIIEQSCRGWNFIWLVLYFSLTSPSILEGDAMIHLQLTICEFLVITRIFRFYKMNPYIWIWWTFTTNQAELSASCFSGKCSSSTSIRTGTATGETPATSVARLRWKREKHVLGAPAVAELIMEPKISLHALNLATLYLSLIWAFSLFTWIH